MSIAFVRTAPSARCVQGLIIHIVPRVIGSAAPPRRVDVRRPPSPPPTVPAMEPAKQNATQTALVAGVVSFYMAAALIVRVRGYYLPLNILTSYLPRWSSCAHDPC